MNTPVAALSRVEGERLIRNPAVWIAFALTGWWLGVAIWGGPGVGSQPFTKYMLLIGYGFASPCCGTAVTCGSGRHSDWRSQRRCRWP